MSDTIAREVGADGLPVDMHVQDVMALVWAQDEQQAEAAEDALRHALWPYYFLFRIVETRRVALGGSCPWSDEASPVLESMLRERWGWVLVAPGTPVEAVAACM